MQLHEVTVMMHGMEERRKRRENTHSRLDKLCSWINMRGFLFCVLNKVEQAIGVYLSISQCLEIKQKMSQVNKYSSFYKFLTWEITYSFLCGSASKLSPKFFVLFSHHLMKYRRSILEMEPRAIPATTVKLQLSNRTAKKNSQHIQPKKCFTMYHALHSAFDCYSLN